MGPLAESWMRTRAVATKEVRQLGRDRLTLAMIVGIPLLEILIFGYSINFDVRHIAAAVVDHAHTSGSRALVQQFRATQVIDITRQFGSPAQLRRAVDSGSVSVGIYIPPDFERRRLDGNRPVVQVMVDASEPTIDSVVRSLVQVPAQQRPGVLMLAAAPVEVLTLYNPEKRTAVQIVPALIGVILNMTMVIFTAIAIVRERERGNLELLITTPVRSAELLAGKLLPYIIVGLIQTTLILFVGRWLFDVPVAGSLVDLYLASGLFIAATLMLGLLISTVAQTQFQAVQLSIFTMLPSILLSGFMFPFDGMPHAAQLIAQVLPLTHFVELVRGIALRGAPIGSMPSQLLKLGLFFVVALTLAALRFRKRLD